MTMIQTSARNPTEMIEVIKTGLKGSPGTILPFLAVALSAANVTPWVILLSVIIGAGSGIWTMMTMSEKYRQAKLKRRMMEIELARFEWWSGRSHTDTDSTGKD